MILALVLFFSFVTVFFIKWDFDKEELERKLTFAWDGITNFRRGLDVSWGTRLTYKISYDKYESTYGTERKQELDEVKNTVENIILQNIDGRISKLWVSDYKAYTQKRNDETQIVVEIWWVTDLDQAKEIIGKTVELEFKLPNKNAENKEERKELATKLYQEIQPDATKMKSFADNKSSENIFYQEYTGKSILELPSFYKEHQNILDTIEKGKLSDVFEGTYGSQQYLNENWEVVEEAINGYTFFVVTDKVTQERKDTNLNDILEVSTKLNLDINQELEVVSSNQGIESGDYTIIDNTLKFNNGKIYDNQEAYKLKIFAYQPNLQGLTWEDYENEKKKVEERKSFIMSELQHDDQAEFDDVTKILDSSISLLELKQTLPDFVSQEIGTIQAYEKDGIIYFTDIIEKKEINDTRYGFVVVNNVNKEQFEKELATKTYYSLQEVFVQDKLSWIPAQSSKGEMLNGANFQYAKVDTSKLWQPVVNITFDSIGKAIFCDITERNIGNQMAIFIWGKLITAPKIQAKICDGTASIEGNYTKEEAKETADSLNDGALPAPLILTQEEKINPSLGDRAFSWAVIALGFGIIAIFIYITILYGIRKWVVTLCSLLAYTIVLLAIVKITDYALSLSGIAAIILSIGMAVDANVLIFERMKEEKENGKDDKNAIKIAYDRSFTAIKDSQISTGIIGFFLFCIGINIFKGFWLMLVVGVILTLLINVPLIKEFLQLICLKNESKEEKAKK